MPGGTGHRWAPRLDQRSTNSQSLMFQAGAKGRGSSQHVCGNSTFSSGSGRSHLHGRSCYLLPNSATTATAQSRLPGRNGSVWVHSPSLSAPLGMITSAYFLVWEEREHCVREKVESHQAGPLSLLPEAGPSPPLAKPKPVGRYVVADNTFWMLLLVFCSVF